MSYDESKNKQLQLRETANANTKNCTCIMGDLVHISAMMQPAPHVSTAGP